MSAVRTRRATTPLLCTTSATLRSKSIETGTTLLTKKVEVYFAQAGEKFGENTSEGWNAYEAAQAMAAFGEISKIANLTFSQTTVQADAEFKLVLDDNELQATDISRTIRPSGIVC